MEPRSEPLVICVFHKLRSISPKFQSTRSDVLRYKSGLQELPSISIWESRGGRNERKKIQTYLLISKRKPNWNIHYSCNSPAYHCGLKSLHFSSLLPAGESELCEYHNFPGLNIFHGCDADYKAGLNDHMGIKFYLQNTQKGIWCKSRHQNIMLSSKYYLARKEKKPTSSALQTLSTSGA